MFEAGQPASEEEIGRIQAELGVVLPEQYVAFLRQFGSTRSFGWQIFGTRRGPQATGRPTTLMRDCVAATKEERHPINRLGTSALPPHVVISTDGGGGNLVLFGQGTVHAGEVHHYNLEDQDEPIRIWETFQNYLEDRIEEATGA
jgi:hypothetical protein